MEKQSLNLESLHKRKTIQKQKPHGEYESLTAIKNHQNQEESSSKDIEAGLKRH